MQLPCIHIHRSTAQVKGQRVPAQTNTKLRMATHSCCAGKHSEELINLEDVCTTGKSIFFLVPVIRCTVCHSSHTHTYRGPPHVRLPTLACESRTAATARLQCCSVPTAAVCYTLHITHVYFQVCTHVSFSVGPYAQMKQRCLCACCCHVLHRAHNLSCPCLLQSPLQVSRIGRNGFFGESALLRSDVRKVRRPTAGHCILV